MSKIEAVRGSLFRKLRGLREEGYKFVDKRS